MHVMKLLAVLCLLLFTTGCSSAQPGQEGSAEPISSVQQRVCETSGHWVQVSAGYEHTCGVLSTGILRCWGRNDKGQLGNGSTMDFHSPSNVFSLGAVKVSAKGNHTCAIVNYPTTGNLWCWGDNANKEIGHPTYPWYSSPYRVFTGIVEPVKDVAVSLGNTCIIDGNDDLRCWGKQDYCQTGTLSTTPTITPTLAPAMFQGDTWPNAAREVTIMNGMICGIGLDDTPRCWGRNYARSLGNNSAVDYSCTPVSPGIPFNDGLVGHIATGLGFTCWTDLNNDFWPYCAGLNYFSQLGRGFHTQTYPYYIGTSAPLYDYYFGAVYITQIDGGYGENAMALDTDGHVYTWGWGVHGENGNGTYNEVLQPEMVMLEGQPIVASQISTGSDHDCVVDTSGEILRCWGLNNHGQLGDYTTTNRLTPIMVPCQ